MAIGVFMCPVDVLADLQPRAGQIIKGEQQTDSLSLTVSGTGYRLLAFYGAVGKLTINA